MTVYKILIMSLQNAYIPEKGFTPSYVYPKGFFTESHEVYVIPAIKKKHLEMLEQIIKNHWNNKNISHPPLNTFTEWFKSWEVYMDDLQKVFENDLSDGIKQVIKREIELYKSIKPICAFSNKPNYLYVFDISNLNKSTYLKTDISYLSENNVLRPVG
jgi:hypothetical protein